MADKNYLTAAGKAFATKMMTNYKRRLRVAKNKYIFDDMTLLEGKIETLTQFLGHAKAKETIQKKAKR